MEIENVGQLMATIVPNIMIVNNDQEIIWMSHALQKQLNLEDVINEQFAAIFDIKMDELNKNDILTMTSGTKYKLSTTTVEDLTFVFFEDLQDLTTQENKLYCLEQVIASISDGVLMSDVDGKIIVYNEAQEQFEGQSKETMEGKHLWEAYNYESKDLSEHQRVLTTGQPILNNYRAHATKDGVPQYTTYNTYPIKKYGENIGVFSVSKNETILKDLLYETIELKRQLFSDQIKDEEIYNTNGTVYTFEDIVGDSQLLKDVIREAKNIAMLENNFLIYGETGTGKEVFAQSIHNLGEHRHEPFVPINCAAIPEGLFEGILFGTVEGSYTGSKDQMGLFEEAGKGTLFLDELNSMPTAMQTKLLRVLQEKRVRRVGGLKTKPINCRIISAVNEDPEVLIKEGKLREDLFYRIAGYTLNIPPLRERPSDIVTMSHYFIKKYNKKLSRGIKGFSNQLQQSLLSYHWPGNVRELEHVIENLIIRTTKEDQRLTVGQLPQNLRKKIIGETQGNILSEDQLNLTETLKSIEKEIILKALNQNNWNVSQTARDLGIIRQSLIYRMKKLDISED